MPKCAAAPSHANVGSAHTAHQKLHALYQSVLQTSAILALLATEMTWPKVMDLLTAKHYSMGHTVWRAGQVPIEIGFVLDGQFELQPGTDNNACGGATTKVCTRGASVAGFATVHHLPLEYSVVAVKYKCTLMTISKSKFTTVLHQLDASRAQTLQDLLVSTHQDDMLALYAPAAVAPLVNTRLPPAPVMPPPPLLPTTLAVEYESSSGTLVLHEPVRNPRGTLKPRLHPICVKAKANMVRRLEQLHVPEHYQAADSIPSPKSVSYHGTVTKIKPVGRLLKALDKQRDPLVVHAERELACGRAASSLLAPTPHHALPTTHTQSVPSLPSLVHPHLRPIVQRQVSPIANKLYIRMDSTSVEKHTAFLGSNAPSLQSRTTPLQRPTTVPTPPPPQ
ncbi:hypothetical protein H310_03923 [Aphanomyces invadans]|uniref:Cyclic nucleotide-binding domain-containing protein n=1 Tax=Aphanomyces invadans TaxID=157072 RepID=A0A024UES9_9STRA|nr:hypothetical protein H310_03923 [Aphanomyces invadans]ETW04784.1 hypothetical protein H310_03923 [Aphanomyces invadans]|eukprot:XP_008866222.1 hypothetical protein H310_03923 [Aphanomyces invadans]